MSRVKASALICLCCLGVPATQMHASSPSATPEIPHLNFSDHVKPLFTEFCIRCHGNERERGGVNLEVFGQEASVLENRNLWEKIREMLESGEMPPANRPQPEKQARFLVVHFIEQEFAKFDCSGPVNPGRVTVRRLNRAEYNNTIRDLLGVDFEPAADFPLDDVGYGFDNIGDVLSLPPLLLEKYLGAAEEIARKAIVAEAQSGPLPESHKRIITRIPSREDDKIECAGEILGAFAKRAYRRPVTTEEVQRLVRFVELVQEQEGTFEEGIQLAVQAVLVSPNFLFRWELDSRSDSEETRELSNHELASRLSYFLWSSMPDEELFGVAEEGILTKPDVLEAQAHRMLQDPKSRALVENFAGQWLQIRTLSNVSPDPNLFPEFDEPLREAMQKETELFFETIMREGRSIQEFIDADFTFVNERLASHYGIDGINGDGFRRISLNGSSRGGILTQASILTLTSNPTRTSPVNRGKWILEQILGSPPPPPPPDVTELEETKEALESASLRERLEQHRAKAECATCHNKMDPLGFALENFDAIGAWRDLDGQFPVDASGVLPGGQIFNGPAELKKILKTQDTFIRTITEKMLTFALGRGLHYYDQCATEKICEALAENDYTFPVLITEIVKSESFRRKQGKGDSI